MSIAIITGASSGLGTCYVDAVTQMFPEVDELLLIARREERLRQVAERCAMCLGCLHRCPKFAIQYGNRTKRHGQYTHPGLGQS